jgi:hypothetical protein
VRVRADRDRPRPPLPRRPGAWRWTSTSAAASCAPATPPTSGAPTSRWPRPTTSTRRCASTSSGQNPPIRIGKAALHDLLLGWLDRLTPDGRAVLVVGRNLGADSLQRWLGEQGFPTDRLASKRGYRLLQARRA